MALPNRIGRNAVGVNALNAQMSRGAAIRTMGVGAAAIGGAALGMSGTARAIGGDEPWDNKIYPTGNAELDYSALQDAVNRGGVVRLMSVRGQHFNLQNYTVIISRSVSIIGQGTKIKFGNVPAFSCVRVGLKLSIRNINFMDLGRAAVNPLEITKPAQGIIQLDLSSIAIGGDEPWD